ncbi:phage tail tape measure protein [Synergistes jonesii]|uniref:phage tail tape measure protein n=1 Tax=Synergistes jonesii TaxID=2754 RepID=UPI00248EDD0A|nr:phage tail tape measure protein [Synergistes jonesii]
MSNTALSVALIIGASLASGFGGAIGSAASKIAQLQKKGESFKIGATAGKQFQELRAESHKVWEEYNATGRSSTELRTRLISLRQSTAAARREAERYGIDIKNVAAQTKHLGTMSAATEARLGRMQANMARRQERGALRGGLLGAAAAATFTLGFPIKAAMGFEAQMKRVGAITKADAAQMEALRKNAREMGRSTQFTASQAASAQEYLGMAGYKTDEIIAAMPGNLALAAAGRLDLARTADISSNILSGFALSAKEAARVADVMAETATSSNTNIEQMGDAMKYAAPLAKVLDVSLEETAAMVGLMGNAGIQGGMAGTALRAAFTRLAKPPREAREAIENLGVAMKDTHGNMRPMPKLLKEIAAATKDMGGAQKAAVYAAIFGQEAVSGMATVLDGATDGSLENFINKLNGCEGAAGRMSKKMNEGARGALVRLGSAAESLAIDIGDVLLPTIAEGADKLGRITSKISDLAQKNPLVTKTVVGLTAGLLGMNVAAKAGALGWSYLANGTNVLLDGLGYLRPSTIQASLAVMRMRGAGSAFGGAVATIGGKFGGFKAGFLRDAGAVKSGLDALGGAGKAGLLKLGSGLKTAAAAIGSFTKTSLVALGSGIKTVSTVIIGAMRAIGASMMANPLAWIVGAVALAAVVIWKWKEVKAFFTGLWKAIKTACAPIGEAIKAPFAAAFQWVGGKIEWLKGKWEGLKNILGNALAAPAPKPKPGKPIALPGHAAGGIFGKPHIAAISEGGKKEAVIPLEGNKKRARSIHAYVGMMLGSDKEEGPRPRPAASTIGKTVIVQKNDRADAPVANNTINKSRVENNARAPHLSMGPFYFNITPPDGSDAADVEREVRKILADLERRARAKERGKFIDAPLFG